MADLGKYVNSLVGRLQGAIGFFMKDTGTFQFGTDGDTYTGRQMELEKLSNKTITQHNSLVYFTGSVLSPAYGLHVFSAATGASKASFVLPAASLGAELTLDCAYVLTDGNYSVIIDSTTGLLLNARGSDLSSLDMSAANLVRMRCDTDGTWSILDQSNFTEHASS